MSDKDTIYRQAAIDTVAKHFRIDNDLLEVIVYEMERLPSAQPEQLTDKEQRIFLAAMGKEEKVCKEVDEGYRQFREPYEDTLVSICHEITRKVKGALWTI